MNFRWCLLLAGWLLSACALSPSPDLPGAENDMGAPPFGAGGASASGGAPGAGGIGAAGFGGMVSSCAKGEACDPSPGGAGNAGARNGDAGGEGKP